jgi:integrase
MNESNHQHCNCGKAQAKPEVIILGLDLHARQVTECRQLDGATPKASAQRWDPWKLLNQVKEWVKAGSKVYSCYEAGACGYWYHRELVKLGATNFAGANRGPRIHDLRHRFAVSTLLRWYRRGKNVELLMPVLSTYLGHVFITGTYWYLTCTPELMEAAAKRLERRWKGSNHA